jgi:integrase
MRNVPQIGGTPLMAKVPSYRRKRCPGGRVYAVVSLPSADGSRKDILLGKYGSPESHVEYRRKLEEWEANRRTVPEVAGQDISISELILKYWNHITEYYRREDGTETSEIGDIRLSLRPLADLYGDLPARDFDVGRLEILQRQMIAKPIVTRIKVADPVTGRRVWAEKVQKIGLSRNVVNSRVRRIARLFAWAASKGLLPQGVPARDVMNPQVVRHFYLQRGRSPARETEKVKPVSESLMLDTLPFMSNVAADLVRLIAVSGMRAGEAAIMRGMDLNTSGAVWLYTPMHHKLAHKDKVRVIALGPKAQEIVRRYLVTDVTQFLFSPKKAMEQVRAEQRANRKTPVQPSQRCRKKRNPKRTPADHYSTRSLSKAVWIACRRAGMPGWHLHQLRHSFATQVRREMSIDDARAALGHSDTSMTQEYAERDIRQAVEVARKLG